MVLIIRKKATKEELEDISSHFEGYTKVVVDLEREILVAGAERHVDEEQLLLENGSKQKVLWGGGVDLETREIDYNSMINLRPGQDNPSRDILDKKIRARFDSVVKKLLL
jgi:hypothetical protein